MKTIEKLFIIMFILGCIGLTVIEIIFPQVKSCPTETLIYAVGCFLLMLPLVFTRLFWLWSDLMEKKTWHLMVLFMSYVPVVLALDWFLPEFGHLFLVRFAVFAAVVTWGYFHYQKHHRKPEEEIDCPE